MRLQTGKSVMKNDEVPLTRPMIRMHKDEASNILNLAASLKILLARSVLLSELPRADALLGEYLQKYLEVRLKKSTVDYDIN